MRRAVALLMFVAACGAPARSGPAWPKPAAPASDGGESLSPRAASSVAAIEDAEDDTPSPAAAVSTPALPPAKLDAKVPAPAAATPDPAAKDPEVLTTEEIIIEIED